MKSGQARRAAASFQSRQPTIHQRTIPAADGRLRRRLFDESLRTSGTMQRWKASSRPERTARRIYRTRDHVEDVGEFLYLLGNMTDQIESADAMNDADQLNAVDGTARRIDMSFIDGGSLVGVYHEGIFASGCGGALAPWEKFVSAAARSVAVKK